VNSAVGGIAYELDNLMARIQRVQTFMAATDLKAAPYSMVPGDETTIKSTMTDLDQLRQVYQGLATRTPAYDYRTFAKQTVGIP
jgi:hypothetical protein